MTQLEKATYRLCVSLSTCSERTRLSSSWPERHLEGEERNLIRGLSDKPVYCFSLSRFDQILAGEIAQSFFFPSQFNRIVTSGTMEHARAREHKHPQTDAAIRGKSC